MKNSFDNNKYLQMQSEHIMERIGQFGDKLYLEFGGKLFDDYHASRVLPGFEPDSKLQMLLQLKDKAEIVIAVSAKDIVANKIRADLGITYDEDVIRLINEFRNIGLYVSTVVITHFNGQKAVENLSRRLKRRNVNVRHHYYIDGYPNETKKIISEEGFGKNDYIETTRPLVVVTAPGPGSGKMATCLSQLYHEHKRGTKAGYAKFETFPIWSIPLQHPVNLAYEAATVDLDDKNMIDPYHLEAYGEIAINYNRDIEIYPVLQNIFEEIYGSSPYKSPTDMGVNMAGFCISDDPGCQEAARQEIVRRYFDTKVKFDQEKCPQSELNAQEMIMKTAGIDENIRKVVPAARQKADQKNMPSGAIELSNGEIITATTSDFMGPCAGLIINSIKTLAGIDDGVHIISPEAFGPIQQLKVQHLKSQNPRLHTDEILIAAALSARTDQSAALALEQLEKLKGAQAHVTSNVTDADKQVFNTLGIELTYDFGR